MEELTPFEKAAIKADMDVIVEALKKTKFRKAAAAELLGIDRKTLYLKIERYHEVFLSEEKVA